jgi:predicted esterase
LEESEIAGEMKIVKRVLPGLLAVLATGILGFIVWASFAAQPTDAALQALKSDKSVSVSQEGGFITFSPAGETPSTGFIFYPGGRVDHRAYAPLLREIAARGYFVALLDVRLNLAFFDINAADEVISKYPEVGHWAVGGHSLGGVAASSYGSKHADFIDGIVLWASYPADDSLKTSGVRVVSIYGTLDGLATLDKIKASEGLLPDDAEYVAIEGGNHSQFGAYGFQDGDNPASIAAEEQWNLVADATANFLEKLTE